jgi:hypothetical protein
LLKSLKSEFIIRESGKSVQSVITFAELKKQSWAEEIKKPKKEKSLKGLSVSQDQQVIKKLLATNPQQRKQANKEYRISNKEYRMMKGIKCGVINIFPTQIVI